MADEIGVTVGLTTKLTHPHNQYENTTFMRTFSRKISIASAPEDPEKVPAYEAWVVAKEAELEAYLRARCEAAIQAEIDAFYEDNKDA